MEISSNPPDDMMTNILSRVPVESLMQWRLVVKSWRDLIKDPDFINMHINQTCASKIGFLIVKHLSESGDEEYFSVHSDITFAEQMRLELPFLSSAKCFEILGSCNGLLCLLYPKGSIFYRSMYLWNPSIRKVKHIPNSPDILALANITYHAVFGFGFLPQINDYRVVRILYREEFTHSRPPKYPPVVEIYSLEADFWRRIEIVVPYFIKNPVSKAFVNKSLHWLAIRNIEENTYEDFIVSFDLVGEVFQEIKLPNCCLHHNRLSGCLSVFEESLCLFSCGYEVNNENWEIWVMKEGGSLDSWSKLFTIISGERISWPLSFLRNGEVILTTSQGELSLYDPRTQQFQDLHCHGNPKMLDTFPYIKSLVMLDRANN